MLQIIWYNIITKSPCMAMAGLTKIEEDMLHEKNFLCSGNFMRGDNVRNGVRGVQRQ